MKRSFVLVILVAAGFAGGVLWMKQREAKPPPGTETPSHPASAKEETAVPQVSHDTNGNAVITMSGEIREKLGIMVKSPAAFQMSPELKGYGRVLDPAPLAALLTELAIAEATADASSKELARLKTLEVQGNASTRTLQTADAAALRDRLTVQSARERLALSWGKAVAEQQDLTTFVRSLTSQETALVRIDLPVGETLNTPPISARLVTLSGQSVVGGYLGPAVGVDPQIQGRGFIFLLKSNSLRLTSGESVIGYMKIPGEPLAGVIIPREAVVRTEGAGWVYVQNAAGDMFTRVEVALDLPTDAGWFVTKLPRGGDNLVVSGAQQLLSLESKGQGGGE